MGQRRSKRCQFGTVDGGGGGALGALVCVGDCEEEGGCGVLDVCFGSWGVVWWVYDICAGMVEWVGEFGYGELDVFVSLFFPLSNYLLSSVSIPIASFFTNLIPHPSNGVLTGIY